MLFKLQVLDSVYLKHTISLWKNPVFDREGSRRIAHFSGVALVWLVSRIPSPPDHEGSTLQGKSGKIR